MYREGHIGAGLLMYAPVGAVSTIVGFQSAAIVGLVVMVALAMVPDQDQRIPGLTHRGITHTVWFAVLLGVGGGLLGGYVGHAVSDGRFWVFLGGLVFGTVVGALSVLAHIAADALTPMGVTPFAPLDDRHYTLDLVCASNTIANHLLFVIGMLAAGAVLALGGSV